MNRIRFFLKLSVWLMPLMVTPSLGQTAIGLLPGNDWLPGWQRSYEVQAYEGDDLFFLINGGADLFLEYGFSDVAAVELKHPTEGRIYVEVYRMASDSAAFGVFSLRRGSLNLEVNPGPWVVYGEDNLHLWQGPFYVSVSSSGLSNLNKLKVFTQFIGFISERAPRENHTPALFDQYRQEEMTRAVYALGPLALNNFYHFGPGNILQVSEALALEKEYHREIILAYPDEMTAKKVFFTFIDHVRDSGRYSDFSEEGEEYLFRDRQGNPLVARLDSPRILVSILKPE